ncbi:MAG: hypothetical protein GY751_26825 [Bacteroidetes bacterium]|nr:hypothetical protein [Bacteroidota bacterium]
MALQTSKLAEHKIRLSYLILALIIFSGGFLGYTYQQMPQYFKKDLVSYDESTNAVVSANLTREFFPPRLRPNSIAQKYQGWKEGPDWQHIPPLFLYVPYPAFMLDGQVTIEARRLSYVFIAYLQGLLFIVGISFLYKKKRAIMMSVLASWLWLLTPFVRGLLNGNYFGYSDIVLSFSVVAAFIMVLGYSHNEFKSEEGKKQWLYFTILVCTLPLLVKSVLGALPLAFLIITILASKTKEPVIKSANVFRALSIPLLICIIYYGLNYITSPEAFRAEIMVPLEHFGNYEGWQKPWHYFISDYLPNRYLQFMFWPFVIALIASIFFWFRQDDGKENAITGSFLIYFLANLAVVSAIASKSANFILQGYLFVLFFCLYTLANRIMIAVPALKFESFVDWLYRVRRPVSVIGAAILAMLIYLNFDSAKTLRNTEYSYRTQNEKFYQFGELCQNVLYSGTRTLFILDTDEQSYPDSLAFKDPDYWMRYYILFNSGSEARRLEEIIQFQSEFDVPGSIRKRYNQIFLVASRETIESEYSDYSKKFKRLGPYKILPLRKSELPNVLPGYGG